MVGNIPLCDPLFFSLPLSLYSKQSFLYNLFKQKNPVVFKEINSFSFAFSRFQKKMEQKVTCSSSSLIGHPGLTLSPETMNWMRGCPDPSSMNQVLTNLFWLRAKDTCVECGDEYPRHELRYDEYGPFSDPNQLICRDCFDYSCEPTFANPEGIQSQWPPFLVPSNNTKYNETYRIRFKDQIVGTVTHYNPQSHTGFVTLYGLEDFAELGSLDPQQVVVDANDEPVGSKGLTPLEPLEMFTPTPCTPSTPTPTTLLSDIPVAYHLTLEDLLQSLR